MDRRLDRALWTSGSFGGGIRAMSESETLDPSEQIAKGVSKGVKESKLKLTDRRMIAIYVVLAVFVILSTIWQQSQTNQVKDVQRQLQDFQHRAQAAVVANCETNNTGNQKFNTALDQLAMNAQNATSLTPEQKAAAVAVYARLHLAITDCSKLQVN